MTGVEDKRGNKKGKEAGEKTHTHGGGQLGFMGHWRGIQSNQNGSLKNEQHTGRSDYGSGLARGSRVEQHLPTVHTHIWSS